MIKTQKIIMHPGAVREIERSIGELSIRSLFFVVDKVAFEKSGARNALESVLEKRNVSTFSDFEANPKLIDVERGVSQYRKSNCDAIIALGGGSALDIGKLVGLLGNQSHSPRELITGQAPIQNSAVSMIAIPTTAGTGSEATHFAVAYIDGQKYSVAHPSSLPDIAIVDPELTLNLPRSITATTGLDAFCQAMESIWAVGSRNDSQAFAREALKLSWMHLRDAASSPSLQSRSAMSLASYLAGKAINISKTTSSHALSYFLTSKYGIPHGMAVAITITQMLKFNSQINEDDCVDSRGVHFVRAQVDEILAVLGCNSVDQACDSITRFIRDLGCPASFHDAGIRDAQAIHEVITSANLERLSNNPRSCTVESLMKLFNE